jgi:hypothetical protein
MKILCFLKRKPGLSREEFINYYEQRHAKLVARLLPFYSQYKRNYIDPSQVYATRHLDNKASAEPPFDVVTEMSFSSREMYDRMRDALADPKVGAAIAADEENAFDRSAIIIYTVDERLSS